MCVYILYALPDHHRHISDLSQMNGALEERYGI